MAKLVGVVLIVLGVLALAYKGFTYTQKTHKTELGPLEFVVKDKERVEVPTWAGIAAVGAGALLLFAGSRR